MNKEKMYRYIIAVLFVFIFAASIQQYFIISYFETSLKAISEMTTDFEDIPAIAKIILENVSVFK